MALFKLVNGRPRQLDLATEELYEAIERLGFIKIMNPQVIVALSDVLDRLDKVEAILELAPREDEKR